MRKPLALEDFSEMPQAGEDFSVKLPNKHVFPGCVLKKGAGGGGGGKENHEQRYVTLPKVVLGWIF
jgi:hypothetical protein